MRCLEHPKEAQEGEVAGEPLFRPMYLRLFRGIEAVMTPTSLSTWSVLRTLETSEPSASAISVT